MSELKAFEVTGKALFGRFYTKKVYDKDEADKVIAELKARIAELEEERRWRKFSEEKPKQKQWVLVFVENPSRYGTYIELRRWDVTMQFDVENQEMYTKWMPLPKAPTEEK